MTYISIEIIFLLIHNKRLSIYSTICFYHISREQNYEITYKHAEVLLKWVKITVTFN